MKLDIKQTAEKIRRYVAGLPIQGIFGKIEVTLQNGKPMAIKYEEVLKDKK